ncbi:hypothetical protein [Microcoleus sp. F10-A1]|uniref:hypothetical protein n=1 Tax=Microcoleus sp. F10-A1 TaxID=2818750 RepID=UPI002FD3FE77
MNLIKYIDINSNPLDPHSIDGLVNYYKVYLDNDEAFKYVEFHGENGIEGIEYYLAPNETIEQVFERFPNEKTITFYTDKETRGIYSKYTELVVDNYYNILGKRIQVYGNDLLPIYDQALDVNTNEKLHFDKTYYDRVRNIHYEFEYDRTTGDFKQLTVTDNGNNFDVKNWMVYPHMVGVGRNPFDFDWEGFEYYKHADPILPID